VASLSYRQLVRLLKAHGCSFKRHGRGDHEIWVTRDGQPFTVPRVLKGEGTLRRILKIAGVTDDPDETAT
jgi:predicted RNA binding protein YcfA (HicA-like mRNA interferase family)